MRILKQASLGLIIDIQERLFPHIHEHDQLLKNVDILIRGLQLLEVPVKFTEQYRKGLGSTIEPLQQYVQAFEPFGKMSFSCCDEKGFNNFLSDDGRKNIIVAGIEAHVCVLQTALDLIGDGYQPVVIEDCISSRKQKDKEIALERMRAEGAIISSYESILFELARISGTDVFKSISKLVK